MSMRFCIEDNAFMMWDGEQDLTTFVREYFENYPDFKDYIDLLSAEENLVSALKDRV